MTILLQSLEPSACAATDGGTSCFLTSPPSAAGQMAFLSPGPIGTIALRRLDLSDRWDELVNRTTWAAAAAVLWCCCVLIARGENPAAPEPPYGLEKRIPWTGSRVIGSPEPPSPYRIVRTLENVPIKHPIHLEEEPGGERVFVIEHYRPAAVDGRIAAFKKADPAKPMQTILELDHVLYGIAFHPNYLQNGLLFVGCNGPIDAKVKKTRVFRFQVGKEAPFVCDPDSQTLVIEWESDGHNGADLAFGLDGMLYVTFGDGTSDSDTNDVGQDVSNLLGTIVRIDVDRPDPGKAYSTPPDNPFVDRKEFRPEIWAYGLRNPWKLTVDRIRGDVWVGQNGQDLWETAYRVERGANYGWSVYEGSHLFHPNRKLGPTPVVFPTVEHHHSEARSLTGGVVYHGDKLPELKGAYIYGDYSTGKVWGCLHDGQKVVWNRKLVDTPLQITGFAELDGELLVLDHSGPIYRLESNPEKGKPSNFPRKLSETGLFASVADHTLAPGVIPYSVNAPLWSDGALKDRFLAVPGDERLTYRANGGWDCPNHTVLVKTFSLETEEGNPQSRRRIETRLLTRQQGEWQGYSYIWNDEQTDATLVDGQGLDKTFTLRDRTGKPREQQWRYPSRAECMVCHSRAANFVLGLSTAQMNRAHNYGGVVDNQLRTLEHIGMFTAKLPQGAPNALVDPYDANQPIHERARSYLHANCSVCHVMAGGGNAKIELQFSTPLEKMFAVDEKPIHDTFGIADARIIAPGKPDQSVLLHRISHRGRGQMPPLASSVVDQQAVDLIAEWIRQLPSNRASAQ